MQNVSGAADVNTKLRTYAAITLAVVVLAIVSFLLEPNTGTLGGCKGLWVANSRYVCISALALKDYNASMCSGLPSPYADTCYSQVAQGSKNATTCASIVNASARSSCSVSVAEAAENYTLCGSAAEPYSSRCEEEVALYMREPKLCSGIANRTYAAECLSILNTRTAAASLSFAPCANVTASANKNVTETIIANLSEGALPAYAFNITSAVESVTFLPNVSYTARDFCYTLVANMSRNSSLCSRVSPGVANEFCLREAAAPSNLTSNSTENYTQAHPLAAGSTRRDAGSRARLGDLRAVD